MELSARIKAALEGATATPAIEFQGRWHSWKDVGDVAHCLQRMLSEAGITTGMKVALVARNRPAHVAALLALLAGRFRTVMVYAFQPSSGLAEDLARADVSAVVASEDDWAPEVMEAVRTANATGISLHEGMGVPRCVVTASQVVMPLDGDAGIAVEMLTSGTTGKPKRIPIRFDTLEKAMAGLIAPGDKAAPDILAFPVGNISGLYYLVPSCVNVHPLVLLEKFSLDAWIDAVKRHRPAYCAVPPATIRMMLDADVAAADVSSLTAVGVGAAPLDPEVQRQFEQRYGIPVLIGYGATEFGGVVAAWTLEDHQQFGAAKRGSVGRARPGAQLRIVDPADSRVLPAGAIGVLQAQVERIGPDWMSTTDLASIDEDGFLFLHGRSDEVINRGGFKIEPQKVETVLRQHPAVAEAAVVGCADPRLGQVPMAAIELRSGAERPTQEQIDAWMRQHLRPQEVPAGYLIVDSLPRTPSFKVRRAGVRELFDANQP